MLFNNDLTVIKCRRCGSPTYVHLPFGNRFCLDFFARAKCKSCGWSTSLFQCYPFLEGPPKPKSKPDIYKKAKTY